MAQRYPYGYDPEYSRYVTYSLLSTDSFIRAKGIFANEQLLNGAAHYVDSATRSTLRIDLDASRSSMQTRGNVIVVETGNLLQARKDLDHNISFEAFRKKYPQARIEMDRLLVLEKQDSQFVCNAVPLDAETSSSWEIPIGARNTTRWRYRVFYHGTIAAVYLQDSFRSQVLPIKYASMVAYYNRLAERQTPVFPANALFCFRFNNPDTSLATYKFLQYVRERSQCPDVNRITIMRYACNFIACDSEYKKYLNDIAWNSSVRDSEKVMSLREFKKQYDRLCAYRSWFFERFRSIDRISDSEEFRRLFRIALDSALNRGYFNDEFEDYVARYGNPSDALRLKLGRHVYSDCGNDDAPRYHLFHIMQLAEQVGDYRTFFKTYDCLMDAPFDGSQFLHHSYFDELGLTQIDVPRFIVGKFFSSKSNYHLFLARLIDESKYKSQIIDLFLATISDTKVDFFNRFRACNLIIGCIRWETSPDSRRDLTARLKKATLTLPHYYAAQLQIERK